MTFFQLSEVNELTLMLERQIQESNLHHREEVAGLEGKVEEVGALLRQQRSKCEEQEKEMQNLQSKVGCRRSDDSFHCSGLVCWEFEGFRWVASDMTEAARSWVALNSQGENYFLSLFITLTVIKNADL